MQKISWVFVLFLFTSCCGAPPKPVPSAYENAVANWAGKSDTYMRDSDNYITYRKETTKKIDDYEKDLTTFQLGLSHEQLEAYGNWRRNSTSANSSIFIQLLTSDQQQAATLLAAKEDDIERSRKLIDWWRADLARKIADLQQEAKDFDRLKVSEQQRSLQQAAAADNAFWHLYDQNMRMGDAMRSSAMDKLWPR